MVLTTGTTDVTGLSFFEAEGAADTDDTGGTEFAEVATLATLAAAASSFRRETVSNTFNRLLLLTKRSTYVLSYHSFRFKRGTHPKANSYKPRSCTVNGSLGPQIDDALQLSYPSRLKQ